MNVIRFFNKSNISQKVIYILYIVSFLIATRNHVNDIMKEGFFPYSNSPFWVNLYWTSLTFLDPIAIIFLLTSLKIGMQIYAIIIFSDVMINLIFTISNKRFLGIFNIFMFGQIAFLVFLLITWKTLKKVEFE